MRLKTKIPYILTTIISTIAILIYFVSPPAQTPNKKLLSIEFNRIAGSDTIPFLFKMMEGAYLIKDSGQYIVSDNKGNHYGQATLEFKSMWDTWNFKDNKPLNSTLWKYISGNTSMNNFIGFLNIIAKTDDKKELKDYAKYFACFYYNSSMNESGEGIIQSNTTEEIYNLNIFDLCTLLDIDAYGFYYTAVVISNMSDKPMHNIRIHIKEMKQGSDNIEKQRYEYFTSILPSFQGCRNFENKFYSCIKEENISSMFNPNYRSSCEKEEKLMHKCQDHKTIDFLEEAHISDKYTKLIFSKEEYQTFISNKNAIPYEISTLAPGKSLFLLLNAYSPDMQGLPKEYLFSYSDIKRIEYSIGNFDYVERNIKPLGVKRMGIITSPSGGIGGQ